MKYIKTYKLLLEESSYTSVYDTSSYKEGDYHQAILDYAYDKWQKNLNGINSYESMIDWVSEDIGKEFAMMILIGKYNQQVGNGGHSQYHFNEYDNRGSGSNTKLHEEMVEMIKKSLLYKMYPITKEAVRIMNEYTDELKHIDEGCDMCDGYGVVEKECDECGGSGEIETYNEDDEIEIETCDECGGSGVVSGDCGYCDGGQIHIHVDHLDSEYYNICDEFMNICNEYSKKLLDVYMKKLNLFRDINKI